MFAFAKPKKGIVNVRMVITEEKILSKIDKLNKLIDPKSKKQIIELQENTYFKDLVESIKTYLIEYPKKKNFPKSVYDAAYELVENATNLFEENTKQIEVLIKQREYNIQTSAIIKQTLAIIQTGDKEWKTSVEEIQNRVPEDVIEALNIIGDATDENSLEYKSAIKLINAKTVNLETNLHIEIDMERVEDKSKALSYIGIEIADALKLIPVPVENAVPMENAVPIQNQNYSANNVVANQQSTANVDNVINPQNIVTNQQPTANVANANNMQNAVVINTGDNQQNNAYQQYYAETRQDIKESLWTKFKKSKFVQTIKYAFRIRVHLSLPEGSTDSYK